MKFLCDVHILLKLSKRIVQLGFDSEHVNNILDKWNTKDIDIANYVEQNDLILITKDQDFRNRFLLNNKPKKPIKVNLGNISNSELLETFEKHFEKISELNQQSKTFMVEINENNLWIITK